MSIVVFLGPTLPAGAVPDGVRVLPPAGQGDVFRAVRDLGATTIGLIDGVFRERPAVWHKELLWALDRGVRVLGAASMGALRAAECAAFGMQPVGRIALAYQDGRFPPFDGPFQDDDEVAVQHAPAAAGFVPLSDAMVDLRATLAAACDAGLISSARRDALAGALKDLPFPRRSLHALEAMEPGLGAHHVALKAADARALLAALRQPASAPAPFTFARTLTWERFAAASPAPLSHAEESALLALALDPQAWRCVARAALGLGAAAPDMHGFRAARGLFSRAALSDWQRRNDVDAACLERLAGAEAALDAIQAQPPADLLRGMADVLRLDDRFTALAQPPANPPAAAEAVGWYLAALGEDVPPSAAEAARRLGFADVTRFTRAVVAWTGGRRQTDAE